MKYWKESVYFILFFVSVIIMFRSEKKEEGFEIICVEFFCLYDLFI